MHAQRRTHVVVAAALLDSDALSWQQDTLLKY